MSAGFWTAARYLGTVALAALAASQQYYPDVHWVAIAIVVLGTLGFHVVPTSPPMMKMTIPPQPEPKRFPAGTYGGVGSTVNVASGRGTSGSAGGGSGSTPGSANDGR